MRMSIIKYIQYEVIKTFKIQNKYALLSDYWIAMSYLYPSSHIKLIHFFFFVPCLGYG